MVEYITAEIFVTLVPGVTWRRGEGGGVCVQIDGVSILLLVKRGFYIFVLLYITQITDQKAFLYRTICI
jgi:hypothetical protein